MANVIIFLLTVTYGLLNKYSILFLISIWMVILLLLNATNLPLDAKYAMPSMVNIGKAAGIKDQEEIYVTLMETISK